MIYVEENPKEAKSFTDETSPKKPNTSARKVSIHGQVIKELPLSWFYDLKKLYPGELDEVKSNRIIEDFHNLPSEIKGRSWAGMKQVIINIVDTLSYEIDYKKILSDVYRHDFAYELLELNADDGDEFAKGVLKRMDEAITEWIIFDSPPQRLKRMMRPRYFPGSLAYYDHDRSYFEEEIDLTPFKAKAASMSGKAVKYASKSGSVFFPAIDCLSPLMMFNQDSWTQYRVKRTLMDSHAFDRGDDKSLKWIDSQRKEVVGRGPFGYYDYYDYENDAFGELYSIPSDSSSYAQAADIAAGFARQDYERYGITAVAGRFDYVTLNGERITQDNAEEKFEMWRQLIEQEQRKHPQVLIFK